MTEIYLDYNASAPMDKRVIESMLPFLENHFGNASSSHGFGRRLSSCVEDSREQIASFVGGSPGGVADEESPVWRPSTAFERAEIASISSAFIFMLPLINLLFF